MNNGLTSLQWYRLLREFCIEEECFVVKDKDWCKKIVEIDQPIDKKHGLHYFKINITNTNYGFRIGRGKKNLIIHKSLVETMESLLLDSGQHVPPWLLIPYDFQSYKENKEKANAILKEKRRINKERVDNLINSNPAYAKKFKVNNKRKAWINNTRKENLGNPNRIRAAAI